MKVVLFCGGQGMRIREFSEHMPKPMVPIGNMPILWHIMKYYAHYGHKDFILCLGYRGDVIKEFFLNYNECLPNDFILSDGGKSIELLDTDLTDWRITFVNTGLRASVGERLFAVRDYLVDDDIFLANYADGLTDLDLSAMVTWFSQRDSVASFVGVKPNHSFHVFRADASGSVKQIEHVQNADFRINGGYFILRRDIFDYMHAGEELVNEPFERLIKAGRLDTFVYNGFWGCMDTFKEKQQLDDLLASGRAPWQLWNHTEDHSQ